ncbi:hypothetical protein [Rhodanobacter sp. L36]|uniref:hypothetical protein n=1 Tax=Rhodanobacter sp. L36 TaxID=1747221 RepID=UPI0015763956|nr:hypothetical protein [Rhodanobacter sp. L36]
MQMQKIIRSTTFDTSSMTTKPVTVPSLARVNPEDLQSLSTAMKDGYWSQIENDAEVSKIMDCAELSSTQGAQIAAIAQRIMSNQKPQGLPWDGWSRIVRASKLEGLPPA